MSTSLSHTLGWVGVLAVAYLLGTFPSAELVARARGIDIRKTGSGNPGASNVTRTLGWKSGAAVMALDGSKGALAAALGLAVDGRPLGYAATAAAVVGHLFPVWRSLRGGKGVATAGGGMLVLNPIASVLLFPLWFVVARWSGKASLASLALVVLLPIGVWLTHRSVWELVATAAIGALIAARHGGNIRRLASRSEPSVG